MAHRPARSLGVVDLALPHDVDPAVRDVPGVVLVDLSALSQYAGAGEGRLDADADVDAARAVVADEVALHLGERRADRVAPTVVALRTMADDVVDAELARLGTRLPGLDPVTRAEVARTVRRVVDKVLHAPTVRVKELAAGPEGGSYEAALRELFALAPEAVEAVSRAGEDPAAGSPGGRLP
jgi:glutamyl-tRNA reductase